MTSLELLSSSLSEGRLNQRWKTDQIFVSIDGLAMVFETRLFRVCLQTLGRRSGDYSAPLKADGGTMIAGMLGCSICSAFVD